MKNKKRHSVIAPTGTLPGQQLSSGLCLQSAVPPLASKNQNNNRREQNKTNFEIKARTYILIKETEEFVAQVVIINQIPLPTSMVKTLAIKNVVDQIEQETFKAQKLSQCGVNCLTCCLREENQAIQGAQTRCQ